MTDRSNYKAELHQKLQDRNYAADYLNAVLEEKDTAAFLLALRDVAQANNVSMSTLAEKANRNDKTLFRTLSKKGNPQLDTLTALLEALGFRLSITPDQLSA